MISRKENEFCENIKRIWWGLFSKTDSYVIIKYKRKSLKKVIFIIETHFLDHLGGFNIFPNYKYHAISNILVITMVHGW